MKLTHQEKVIINEALQFYPYINAVINPPKEHKRYLCIANIDAKALCACEHICLYGYESACEHICLYDYESKRWLYNRKEVTVHCYMEIPTVIGVNVQSK